ncbi:hypothetical protein L3X38_036865 [Prunus dulcis]|uniref:Uncharacterized protein n=1 Tax=Prunus dulcis TaxID=3755 RepID=A0AAD4V3E7_PRUDU|nr:hypothetical protein L3X38_036865 [Prunus dulcis]
MAIFARNFAGSDLPPPAAISGDQGLAWRRLSGVETDPIRDVGCTGVWGDIRIHEAFWELTGFRVVGTPKLSELGARAIPGWVTHWEVAREFPETKP